MKGTVWKFGDDIDTDIILPGRYLIYTDEERLSQHCMEGLDDKFNEKCKKGDFIVAGKNFGCGSSREHAPIALKGVGVAAVIAESFARIFYRNATNVGVPLLEAPGISKLVENGEEIELHGEDRRDTNEIIRLHVGTYEDFILTAASIQSAKNLTSFIDMGNSERKDLLVKFIGLNVFDKLHDKGNEKYREISAILKSHNDRDYGEELKQCNESLEQIKTLFEVREKLFQVILIVLIK